MPLTRHFYSSDEVLAALQYSSYRNEHKETLFWCKELLLSGYITEAISTLFQAWLWHKGDPLWLVHAWKLHGDELTEDDILLSTYQLSVLPQDHSLWNVLASTAAHPSIPDRVTYRSPEFPSDDPKEMYFIRALYQGKGHSAFWISRYISYMRVWELLEWYVDNISASIPRIYFEALQNYERLLGYKTDEYDSIVQCSAVLAVASLRFYMQKPIPQIIDPYYVKLLTQWDSINGRRSRRLFSIPTGCLYGATKRGRMKSSQQNTKELNYVETSMIGCPFWEEALSKYATIDGSIQWKSDDDLENFYDIMFPDDIPDEWTKKEKEMSHGCGVLGNEEVSLKKYATLYLMKKSRFVWVQSVPISVASCDPSIICKHIILPELDIRLLEPVKKRLCL
jgi:hypothetical protein